MSTLVDMSPLPAPLGVLPQWQVVAETIPRVSRFLAADPHSHGLKALAEVVWQHVTEVASGWQRGAPFVWYNLGFTPELLLGLDGGVGRICVASMAALQSIGGDPRITEQLIDRAEGDGVPADCCSAEKAAIGAMLAGLYPRPVCAVGINTPCDAQVVSTQVMAEISGAPLFVIDVPPYGGSGGDDARTIAHVASQLAEMVPFLERHSGCRFDWGRLRRACERANASIELLWDWLDWRRRAPLTQASKLVAFTFVHQILFSGTAGGVKLAAALEREARQRWQRGERFFEEQVRAIWYQDPVWTDFQIYDWMERELGLTVPVDVFGYYAQEGLIDTSSERTMLAGLARKLVKTQPMSRQFRGDIESYISDFMQLHEAFRADCGIFAGHVACKHAWAGLALFREACRRRGIPLLVFEFDMFDARVTPREAIEHELRRFVEEVVLPRKRAGRRSQARGAARPPAPAAAPAPRAVVESFFERCAALGPLLAELVGCPAEARFVLRDAGAQIQLRLRRCDGTGAPRLQVGFGEAAPSSGAVSFAASAADLQLMLGGALSAQEAVAQRRLLLSGAMRAVVRWLPLLDLVPPLFAVHRGGERGVWRRPTARRIAAAIGRRGGRLIGRAPSAWRRRLLDSGRVAPLLHAIGEVSAGALWPLAEGLARGFCHDDV